MLGGGSSPKLRTVEMMEYVMIERRRKVTEIGMVLGCINDDDDSNTGPNCCLTTAHASFNERELDNCVSIMDS